MAHRAGSYVIRGKVWEKSDLRSDLRLTTAIDNLRLLVESVKPQQNI